MTSNEAQAGTTAATPPENRQEPEKQVEAAADGSGLNAQQQKEWMTLKQKAEEFNKLAAKAKELEERNAQLERLAFSRGAGTATDPEAERLAQLREQATFDPVAAELLTTKHRQAVLEAELWLQNEIASVPESKKDRVASIIRNANYQMRASDALSLVTDPDTDEAKKRLAELEAELARLKERGPAQAHGASPAATVAATPASDSRETLPWSEVQHTLKLGGAAAKELRDKMDSGKLKPDYNR